MHTTANVYHDLPDGALYGWFSEQGLQWLDLPRPEAGAPRMNVLHSAANDGRGRKLCAALDRYFSGLREDFTDIPLDLSTGTAFQQAVWEAARATKWGHTDAYGALAKRVGRSSGAARAVGQALGANPLAILVPCHRFIAADGRLTGFAAGLDWKRRLLRLEGVSPLD